MPYGKKKIELIYEDLTYLINGVLFSVHNELGRFAREKQYGDLVEKKLKEKKVSFTRELVIADTGNIVDFEINGKIILEIKAKPFLVKDDYYQIQRYLKVTNYGLGILVNFRSTYLKSHRILPPYQLTE